MSHEMTTQEIIFELDRIDALYTQKGNLERDMIHNASEKEAEEDSFVTEIVETLNAFQEKEEKNFGAKKPNIAPACLETPPEPPKKPDLKNPAKDVFISALSGIIMFGCIALWIITVITPLDKLLGLLNFLISLAMLGAIGFWFCAGARVVTAFVDWENKQKEWKIAQTEWEAKFNKSATKEENDRFLSEFKEYDACFLALVDVCTQKYNEEIEHCDAGLEVIRQKYLDKATAIDNERLDVIAELDKVTLIHQDLFDNAWRISYMLQTGRADTLKEAINLALDEERKEQEEAARQEEAQKQEAILQQQAYENRMHNAAMERAAEEEARAQRAHNAAMERAAEAQAREAAKQTAMAQQQARDAQRAASARCGRCVNSSKCSYQVKQNSANCSGYRPQ